MVSFPISFRTGCSFRSQKPKLCFKVHQHCWSNSWSLTKQVRKRLITWQFGALLRVEENPKGKTTRHNIGSSKRHLTCTQGSNPGHSSERHKHCHCATKPLSMFKTFGFSTSFSYSSYSLINLFNGNHLVITESKLKKLLLGQNNFPQITMTGLTLNVLRTHWCCLCFSTVKHYMTKAFSHNQWTRHICRLLTLRGNTYFIDIFHFCWHNEPTINSIPVFVLFQRAHCQ